MSNPPSETHILSPDLVAGELIGRALESKPVTGGPLEWEPPAPETLQSQLPGYAVECFLARGGMGAVYRGVQVSLERRVAIKILPPYLTQSDPLYAERFKNEARAMAQLSHPAIVAVYDFGQMTDGTLYFVMEYIDGTDVAQMVQNNGRLHSEHAMAITAHVCDALQYAHERGVVHRDIKPANIMVGYDGRVKVADFGLAKSMIRGRDYSLTQTGFVMGTPHFLAPEAMMLGGSLDHRADIYAVGVMLYQMLTGKLPQGVFEMPSLQVPGLDPRYDQIIINAMREDRDQRYPSVMHLRRALDAILTQPVQAYAPTSHAKTVQKSSANSHQTTNPASPGHSSAHSVPRPGSPALRPSQGVGKTASPPSRKGLPLWPMVAVLLIAGGLYFYFKPSTPQPAQAAIGRPVMEASDGGGHALPSPEPKAPDPTIQPPMDPPPAAQPPQATTAIVPPVKAEPSPVKADQVKLEFKNAENFYDVGGYQPIGLLLATAAPASVLKSPPDLSAPLYGELSLGQAAKRRTHAVIVSHPKTPEAKLYFDKNANGDLTDDPPSSWKAGEQKNFSTGETTAIFEGEFMADLVCEDATHPARFRVFQNVRENGPAHLWIHPEYGRTGLVKLNGATCRALLYDDGATGDFSAPTSTFRLDLSGEGDFRSEKGEVFPVTGQIQFKGAAYRLLDLAPGGHLFRIVPVGAEAPKGGPGDLRTYTDMQGRTLKATLLQVRGDDVNLRREDGREFTIKAGVLSKADVEFLKTQGLVMPVAVKTPPKAATPPAPPSGGGCTTAERLEALQRNGGAPEIERAVTAALEYLKARQNPDGSWGDKGCIGRTALCLMAYTGRCETMDSKAYGDTLLKGMMFFIQNGMRNSGGIMAAGSAGPHSAAEHGMVVEVLGQLYLAARKGSKTLPGMREAFEKEVRLIIDQQASPAAAGGSSILSLAWQSQALHTARLTKIKFPGLNECTARMELWLKENQNPDGSFGRQSPETTRAVTGAGAYALLCLPGEHQTQLLNSLRFARQHFEKAPLEGSNMDLLSVLPYTRAFFSLGGEDWKFWNGRLLPQLLATLKPDGSASCPSSALMKGNDVDNTALAALILETYYHDSPGSADTR